MTGRDPRDLRAGAGDGGDERDERVDEALSELAGPELAPPPLSADLEAELRDLAPVRTRRPRRTFAKVAAASMLYGAGMLWLFDLRPDLHGLSTLWMILYCTAWLSGFLVLGWFTMVPGPGKIMPNWRYAGVGAVIAAVGFVAAGLIFHRHVPDVSHVCSHDLSELIGHGHGCMRTGLLIALVPVLLGALLLRGALPVGSRWAGAGLGAAGGALGGLILHLHCHHTGPFHLGLVHGGVVVVSALIGAAIIPRVTRP